jgi:DnaJ like chaperone protein
LCMTQKRGRTSQKLILNKLATLFSKSYLLSYVVLVIIFFVIFRNIFAAFFLGIFFFLILGHQLFGGLDMSADKIREGSGKLPLYNEHFAALMAAMMRADSNVDPRQIAYIKNRVEREYFSTDAKNIQARIDFFVNLEALELDQVFREIREEYSLHVKIQLLHILVAMGVIDGVLTDGEFQLLKDYCSRTGIPIQSLNHVLAMFRFKHEFEKTEQKTNTKVIRQSQLDDAYEILELDKSAGNAEIKRAYKKLAKKFHPDALIGESEQAQKVATEKFKIIVNAYDLICKKRGIV